jgi:hypothetical protein
MHAISLAVFFAFMLAIGIWILPFVLIVAIGTAAIAVSSSVIFWIFGPPELPSNRPPVA